MRPPGIPLVTTLPAPRDMGADAVDPHCNGTGMRFTDKENCCGIWPMVTSSEERERIPSQKREKKERKKSYTVPQKFSTVRPVICGLQTLPISAPRRGSIWVLLHYPSSHLAIRCHCPNSREGTTPLGNIRYRMKAYFVNSFHYLASAHPMLALGAFPVWQSASAARVERWYSTNIAMGSELANFGYIRCASLGSRLARLSWLAGTRSYTA